MAIQLGDGQIFHKDIKGFSVVCRELPVTIGAVRKYYRKYVFFDHQIGVHEPTSRIRRNRQQGDSVVHVAKIGIESQLELTRDLALLLPKLRGEGIEDRFLNALVEFVDVDLLHPLPEALALLLEPGHRGVMVALHCRETLSENIRKPLEHAVGHRNAVEHGAELLEEHLLTHIRLGALLPPVAASIVYVFLLLDVADEQASAMAALDHSGEEEVLFYATYARSVAAIEHALDAFPELGRDQRLV